MHYSGFWRRFFAFLVDTVITVVAGMALGLMLGVVMAVTAPFDRLGVAKALANLSGFLLGWLYFAGMESSVAQATLGKQLLGMRVTDLDGNPIGFGRASGRYFAKILSSLILLIGYLMAAFTSKKQGLHDILAGCLVVNGRAR
ncbi:MAG: RDD family protein [Porticoccaceae bacterium]